MNILEKALNESIKRPNTLSAYHRAVAEFIVFAGTDPRRWVGATATAWRQHLLLKGLNPRSVNAKLAALRFAVRRAVNLNYLATDFSRAAEFLPLTRTKVRKAIPIEIGKRILSTCDSAALADVRDKAVLRLGFYHGLRRESIAGLAVEDIDLRNAQITVTIKGGRRHGLSLSQHARPALLAWLHALAKQGIRSGPVFRQIRDGKIGERLSPQAIYKIVKQRAEQAGVEGFYPHLMRHCFITWAVANGASIEEIMLVTGHRNPATVSEYLSEVRSPASRRELIKSLTEED